MLRPTRRERLRLAQVADRFHLLMNLRETLERFFDRHQAIVSASSVGERYGCQEFFNSPQVISQSCGHCG